MHNEIGYTSQCISNSNLHLTLDLLVDMCHPSTFLSLLRVIQGFNTFAVIICKWNMYNNTSSVLSPEKRFMTLVCQVRYGDQVALGYAPGASSTNWKTASGPLLHRGPSVKIEHINISTRQFPLVLLSSESSGLLIFFSSNCAICEIFCVSVETFQQGLRHFTGIGGFLPRRNGDTLSISILKGQSNRKFVKLNEQRGEQSAYWKIDRSFGKVTLLSGTSRNSGDTPEMRNAYHLSLIIAPSDKRRNV